MGCQSSEEANRVHGIRRMENGKGRLWIFSFLSAIGSMMWDAVL